MLFLSCQTGLAGAVKNAGRFAAEAEAQVIKIEAGGAYLDVIKAVSDGGDGPHWNKAAEYRQETGKFRAEATTAQMGLELISLAEQMANSGASLLLVEGAAAEVAEIITDRGEVPVIGCGSGPSCDGQILIAPDILGLTRGPSPKFAKSYGNLGDAVVETFKKYSSEVKAGRYPDKGHSYHMKKGELERLRELLKDKI
jgi:3-methyl-2-oxobutanoate hydroxymethyltransferase